MASINKVILVGNLGRDPEMRSFANGSQAATISLATTDRWRDKNTGENKEATEWHRVIFHERLAEIVGQFLRKGSQVYIEGSLRTRKWTDQATGQERYATEIRGDSIQMLGSPNDNQRQQSQAAPQQQNSNAGYGDNNPPTYAAPAQQPRTPRRNDYADRER